MITDQSSSSPRQKLALIIGNDNYSTLKNKLNHSINNARDLSDQLKKIGFNVTLDYNLTKQELIAHIIDFSKQIYNGDIILFYFAGHGFSVNGKNYLIPIDDTEIEDKRDVEDFSVNVERTISRFVTKNPSHATIFILDCCRSYWLKSSNCKDLVEIQPPTGSFIQFACCSNQTVDDCNDKTRNCLFSKHLLRNIARENVDVTEIFRDISEKVYMESNSVQKPLSMNGLDQHTRVFLNEVAVPAIQEETGNEILPAEEYLSTELLSPEEKLYYERCKEYYQLAEEPLISVANEIFDNTTELESLFLVIGIDEDYNQIELKDLLEKFFNKINVPIIHMQVKQIQIGSCIVTTEILNKFNSSDKKLKIRMICKSLTQKLREALAQMKIFFMFMGSIESLKRQQTCAEISLNPQYNRIYSIGHDYWEGALNDGRDRGNQPYYCPIGWKRASLYVTDDFDGKFKGWCICYHGTKFAYGLSILLSGLKPATIRAHGTGIYVTPSINYACHPRYAEVKLIDTKHGSRIFKSGKYIQYVLECRVHPDNIKKIKRETLGAHNNNIDSNISNDYIEWIIDEQGKSIVDFNDPDSSIVCTGIMMRITDEHPGLLPKSQWWYTSHLCNNKECCFLGIDRSKLTEQQQNGKQCNIILQ